MKLPTVSGWDQSEFAEFRNFRFPLLRRSILFLEAIPYFSPSLHQLSSRNNIKIFYFHRITREFVRIRNIILLLKVQTFIDVFIYNFINICVQSRERIRYHHLLEQRSIYTKFLSNFRSIEQNQKKKKKRKKNRDKRDKKTRRR